MPLPASFAPPIAVTQAWIMGALSLIALAWCAWRFLDALHRHRAAARAIAADPYPTPVAVLAAAERRTYVARATDGAPLVLRGEGECIIAIDAAVAGRVVGNTLEIVEPPEATPAALRGPLAAAAHDNVVRLHAGVLAPIAGSLDVQAVDIEALRAAADGAQP